jgi:hypothetical protein
VKQKHGLSQKALVFNPGGQMLWHGCPRKDRRMSTPASTCPSRPCQDGCAPAVHALSKVQSRFFLFSDFVWPLDLSSVRLLTPLREQSRQVQLVEDSTTLEPWRPNPSSIVKCLWISGLILNNQPNLWIDYKRKKKKILPRENRRYNVIRAGFQGCLPTYGI